VPTKSKLKIKQSAAFALPATVSRPPLLDSGSDDRFRQLVYDLLTISVRMEAVREHLARRLGVSGPQYSVLMAIARFQGRHGVRVGTVAKALHVTSAFIATETGRLARLGLVCKNPNPKDRRGVLLALSPKGESALVGLGPEIRAVNDEFFKPLERTAFHALATTAAALVESSSKVERRLHLMDDDEWLAPRFRSSSKVAATSETNFGSKGALANL
jgi:MarR family transcriptional regulator, organic hydroperoxide resistance regulator